MVEQLIFISYPTQQLALARKLRKLLERQLPTATVFLAEDCVPYAYPLATEIVTTLLSAHTTFVIWDSNASASQWVRFETTLAYGLDQEIVTLKLCSDPALTVPEHLGRQKYLDVARYGGDPEKAMTSFLKQWLSPEQQHARAARIRTLQKSFERNLTPLSTDEDEFYRFGTRLLKRARPHQEGMIFASASGTPALLLPDEDYTRDRHLYIDILLARLTQLNRFDNTYYMFDFRKMIRNINLARKEDPEPIKRRLETVLPALRRSRLRVYGLRGEGLQLPSAILSNDEGALILRDPRNGSLIGIKFIAGVQLDAFRNRLYRDVVLSRSRIVQEERWLRRFGFAA